MKQHNVFKLFGKGLAAFTALCLFNYSVADNPLVPNVGMADPHIKILGDTAYLYATRDADPKSKDWNMPEWTVWSSKDLVEWKQEAVIRPEDTYIGKSQYCWAPDVAFKNNRTYFYFSNHNIDTGVAVAQSPVGPFKDALGKPLLPQNLLANKEYDPTVLVDDDANQSAYLAFGHHRSTEDNKFWAIAKLNDDMISLAEKPKEIKFTNTFPNNDKPNLHKFRDTYYLSAGAHYGTSKNIYGPYTYKGSSGDDNKTYGLNSRAHGNYFEWRKQWFHVWCHFQFGKEVAKYRESKMTYIHYRKNGDMVSDVGFLDKYYDTGVGQYDAHWPVIEAEWYMAMEKAEKVEKRDRGFEIRQAHPGATLFFPNLKNMGASRAVVFNATSKDGGGSIVVRAESPNGRVLANCPIPQTGDWLTYENTECKLADTKKVKNIYLTFSGRTFDMVRLDSFWFLSKFKK